MTYYLILPPHWGSPQPYITWERGGQPTRPATHTSSAQVAFCNRNSVEKVDLKFILYLYQKLQFIKCLSIEIIARDSPSDAIDNEGALVSITGDLQNVTFPGQSRHWHCQLALIHTCLNTIGSPVMLNKTQKYRGAHQQNKQPNNFRLTSSLPQWVANPNFCCRFCVWPLKNWEKAKE